MSRKKYDIGIIFKGIPERIKEVRKKAKLSQAEFGKKLGLSQGTINKYEAGRVPNESILKKISAVFNIDYEWLLNGEEANRCQALFLREEPELYLAKRPEPPNLDYLARSIALAKRYIIDKRLKFSLDQEAKFATYIYEYFIEKHDEPNDFWLKQTSRLIGEKEGT